ncbi:MAG TPA: ATP-binding protein [Candidatus Binatia bacterium]|nr:ATP-binding protein [Candidatus Binatia bacterium]
MGPKFRTLTRSFPLLAILLFIPAGHLLALDPTSRISQYGHSTWRVQDGYFGAAPRFVAQTTDGYIWVGTGNGLFKFDGVRFVRWDAQPGAALPSPAIRGLLGASDGSLWIGTDAGLAHLANGRLTLYEQGWGVARLVEDKNGNIWFTQFRSYDRSNPLCQVHAGAVHCYGSKDGLEIFTTEEIGIIALDASGDLWMGGENTLVRWRPGDTKVYRPQALRSNPGYAGVVGLAAAPDGSVWVGVVVRGPGGGLQRLIDGTLKPFLSPELNGETLSVTDLHRDHQGNLWVATVDRGIYKIHDTDVDHYGGGDGLSADFAGELFEDRDGDIWVMTTEGLDMFHDLRVQRISAREGLSEDAVESVAAGPDGKVYVGTSRVQFLEPGKRVWESIAALKGEQISSLFVDHSGLLWAGVDNKLFVGEQQKFREITRSDGGAMGIIVGIAEDPDRNIWVESSAPPGTLIRIRDGKVQEIFSAPAAPVARRIVADADHGIWLGLVTGDLARFRDGQAQTFSFGEHAQSRVLAITRMPDGAILAGTAFGVVAWKNGKQQILSVKNGLPCNFVSGLITDDAGNLWLYSQCAVIEVPPEQMQVWWEHPGSKLNLKVFDALDGFRPGWAHFSTSAKTPDGRLWFATGRVLQVIDPAHLPQSAAAPAVHISTVVADHKEYSAEPSIKLPALTRDLEIDYTAPSYAAPQKVLFRYMLEGRDAAFQEAGTRRQAFYNDLRPGHYRFHVIACNGDGVWNEAGAALNFSVLPAYYQTTWFRVLCAGILLALLWAAYRERVRQLRQQEKKLRDVIETMPTFAWTALPDGTEDFVNRHWNEYSGLSIEESAGTGWQTAVHPADLKPHLEKWHASLATGESLQNEVRYRRADGEYRWFLARAVPLRDKHGKILKWYGISTDIEDRKRAEHEREQLRADLAHMNRVTTMGELTASLAHEIKQPITASVISAETCLEWLKADHPNLEEVSTASKRIAEAGRRACDIIDRLRSLYKKTPSQREIVDVNEIIREMTALLRSEAIRYAVSVRTELAAELPWLCADRVQLQQVLMNVMLNGIEAMKETGGLLTLKSELDGDRGVLISISDTGVGLPADNSDQIFNAFFTTKANGSGMGLAISRSILESHGGRLWATHNKGRGATFHFTLPAAREAQNPPAIPA